MPGLGGEGVEDALLGRGGGVAGRPPGDDVQGTARPPVRGRRGLLGGAPQEARAKTRAPAANAATPRVAQGEVRCMGLPLLMSPESYCWVAETLLGLLNHSKQDTGAPASIRKISNLLNASNLATTRASRAPPGSPSPRPRRGSPGGLPPTSSPRACTSWLTALSGGSASWHRAESSQATGDEIMGTVDADRSGVVERTQRHDVVVEDQGRGPVVHLSEGRDGPRRPPPRVSRRRTWSCGCPARPRPRRTSAAG